jgi:hypothetical protein
LAKEAATEREVLAALCCPEVKIEMAKQKAQLGAEDSMGWWNQGQMAAETKNRRLKTIPPNTSDEENYQIRKMKTQRASYLRSEGKTQPRRGHTSALHRSRASPR